MSQLRLLYTSNAFWAASGYGVQGRSLLPRLAELPEINGRDNIAMFAWYGLQGGVHNVEGFRIYPAGADPYGNDIIGAHVKHFDANVVISLIDVWVMKETAAKVAPALWCVPGYTLVEMNDGHKLPIKDLYNMKGNRRAVLGHDGTQAVEGLITDYHYMGVKPTLEIETMTGRRLRITAESGIYVNRNGCAEWIAASCVTPGDMVYCIAGNHNLLGGNNDQLGTKTHDGMAVSDRYQGNGTSLFSGNSGWRGRNQYSRSHQAETLEGSRGGTVQNPATSGTGVQHRFDANSLAARPDRIQVQRTRSAQGAHELPGGSNGLSYLCDSRASDAVLNCQETASEIGDRVHANSGRTVGLGTQPELRAARSGNLANTPRVELEEVRSVRSTGVLEPVYDLTTSTHNFFANGILIHNCPWLPIDHDPVPQIVLDCLQGAHLPLTYSKWGHQLLADAGVDNLYIPHGIEPSVYRVNSDQEAVNQFRQQKLRDVDHLTVMVAANKGFPDRKAFQVQLRSWAKFAKDKPGAKLYIHTEPSTRYGGIDMFTLLRHLGIGERVFFPNQYEYSQGYSAEYLAMMYNAADVFMGAAMAEGFGIPIIEAQACGTPVIVTDFSSMPELVRWGYKVAPRDMWWSPLNAWQAWPDVDGIHEALEELYAQWHDQGDRWELRQRLWASEQIHQEYSWDTITRDQWAPLMTRLAGEVVQPEPVAAEPVQRPTVPPKKRVKLEHVGPEAVTA